MALFRSDDAIIGDGDDELLWRISSSRGELAHVVIGSVPHGFAQDMALKRPLDPSEPLGVLLKAKEGDSVIAFTATVLRDREVYTDGGNYESEADFVARETQRCE